jgi:hypothetical protein
VRRLTLCCAVMLAGCDVTPGSWNEAPETHVCSEEQMKKVEAETMWCRINTSYLSEYCYGTAIIRNCEARKGEGEV